MKKYVKYVSTPVEVCKKPVKTLQKLCIYILFTYSLHTLYRPYSLVTYFAYFLIKSQKILVFIFIQNLKEDIFVEFLNIEPFTGKYRHYILYLIQNYRGEFPLFDFIGGF